MVPFLLLRESVKQALAVLKVPVYLGEPLVWSLAKFTASSRLVAREQEADSGAIRDLSGFSSVVKPENGQ